MPNIEVLSIEAARLEFESQRGLDFFDCFLGGEPTGNILVYRGDFNHQGNLSVADLNPKNSPSIDGIIIDGNLAVTGTLSNYIHRVKLREDCGLELLVTGSMTVHNLISTNATIYVHRDLKSEVVYLFYDNGTSMLRVDGTLWAKALLINDEHGWYIDECEIEHDIDLYECDYAEIREIFIDEVIGEEDTKIEHDCLIAALESDRNIFR
jgi:hypothetical protein